MFQSGRNFLMNFTMDCPMNPRSPLNKSLLTAFHSSLPSPHISCSTKAILATRRSDTLYLSYTPNTLYLWYTIMIVFIWMEYVHAHKVCTFVAEKHVRAVYSAYPLLYG